MQLIPGQVQPLNRVRPNPQPRLFPSSCKPHSPCALWWQSASLPFSLAPFPIVRALKCCLLQNLSISSHLLLLSPIRKWQNIPIAALQFLPLPVFRVALLLSSCALPFGFVSFCSTGRVMLPTCCLHPSREHPSWARPGSNEHTLFCF